MAHRNRGREQSPAQQTAEQPAAVEQTEVAQSAEETTVAAEQSPAEDGKASQDAALESVGIVLPESPRVYQVSIDNCLLGRRYVLAHSEAEAIEKYKRPCGIVSHAGAASAAVTALDASNLPAGVELWGEAASG